MVLDIEDLLQAKIREVDRADQQKARRVLRRMVETGAIAEGDLDVIATPKRGYRKPLRYLTVQDLIDMGIVRTEAVA